jgi:hypothetical protein
MFGPLLRRDPGLKKLSFIKVEVSVSQPWCDCAYIGETKRTSQVLGEHGGRGKGELNSKGQQSQAFSSSICQG